MCGIAGIYNFNDDSVSRDVLLSMTNAIQHRGPDFGDVFVKERVGLGHRRLSIVDLSAQGNQPMHTSDGKLTIVFNGEVYNFIEIREELKALGYSFVSHSDTEVVLVAYQVWGTSVIKRFNGMFAFAIYDHATGEVCLARDQYGIKPLYYFKTNNEIVFGSEIKVLKKHTSFNSSISNQALSEYLWYGNAMGNSTFYENVKELNAGSYMLVNSKGTQIHTYFDVNKITPIHINEQDAVAEIQILFDKSIQRHLISDVPVGVFLSGGIDSSAITAYAAKHYQGQLNTYSVAFDFQKGPNELEKAKSVAQKFNTNHHEIYIEGNQLKEVVHALVDCHDEPFGDAANIPLYLLTQQLKGDIKVVLQGDGGDEFFGGYSRYFSLMNKNKFSYLKWLPWLVSMSRTENRKVLQIQRYVHAMNQKDRARRNALLLTMESNYSDPLQVLNLNKINEISVCNPFLVYDNVYESYHSTMNGTQALFYTDTQIILKDTFLEKVDKSTMANSMEVRVPFLDKDLTEFMLSVPSELKVKNGVQKYLLKKAMEGTVPNDILYGAKTGFSVPYAYWLKNSLASDFNDQLTSEKGKQWFNISRVQELFKMHQAGKGNYGFLLWKVYILCIWLNKQ
jgi:asparagine synthase (glutamine-hydrolysing)